MHSGCKHCTSRFELHGIGDTSPMLHDHFWLPDAKRCPERRGEEKVKRYVKIFDISTLNTVSTTGSLFFPSSAKILNLDETIDTLL